MTRRDVILLVLAADAKAYNPAQLQRALLRVSHGLPDMTGPAERFDFSAITDAGLRDPLIESDVATMQTQGLAVVTPGGVGRWAAYTASVAGRARAQELRDTLADETRRQLQQIVLRVLYPAIGRDRFQAACLCPEC